MIWTAIGLAGGLFYREWTKTQGYGDGSDLAGTQLAVVHTHTLVLGTVMLLILLALVAQFRGLAMDRRFRWGVWVWQGGLALSTATMLVKGSMQVAGTEGFDSPALSGIAGLGHIALTVAFVLLFLGLSQAVRQADRDADRLPHVTA